MLFQCWAGVSQVFIYDKFCSLAVGDHVITQSVCTFKQQSQKAVFAHFTSEQILPLQANNVLQPVVWGRPRAVGVYTPCLLTPCHFSLYPLRLCNMVHCDIKTADCGIFPFNCKYLGTKNDIFVIFS